MRRLIFGAAGAVALLFVPAGAAEAATSYVTTAAFTYLPGEVTIAPGDSLQYANVDLAPHNVVSTTFVNGRPLFESETVGTGSISPVAGVESLGVGTYPFMCSVHPNMRGALLVR